MEMVDSKPAQAGGEQKPLGESGPSPAARAAAAAEPKPDDGFDDIPF